MLIVNLNRTQVIGELPIIMAEISLLAEEIAEQCEKHGVCNAEEAFDLIENGLKMARMNVTARKK